jgi:hypothetical protein
MKKNVKTSPSLNGVRRFACGLIGVLLALALTTSAMAQIPATYTGASGGLWSDPDNWDIEEVPVNDGVNTYAVVIPAGVTVNFDIDGASEVTSLSLGDNARINFTADRTLSVVDETEIGGLIHATGPDAGFFSLSPLASFSAAGRGRAHAREGAAISIAAEEYSGNFTGTASWDVFIAADPGSAIDLSPVTSFALPNGDYVLTRTFAVTASNGGVIDLSSVTDIQGASGNNWARFNILSDGQINLDSVESITGRTRFQIGVPLYQLPVLESVIGASIFTVDSGNVLEMPLLTTASGATFDIADGGTVNAPNLTSFTNGRLDLTPATTLLTPSFTEFDNSRVFLSEGRVFDGVSVSSYTFNPGGTESWDVFGSTGAGSLLDLSSLGLLAMPDDGYVLTRTFAVTASNDGEIDLSNVTDIEGPGGNNWARFNILSGGQINLDSLQTITGRTFFRVESPMFELPSLSSIAGASTLSVGAGSTFSLPLLNDLTSATLVIDDGGTIALPAMTSFTGGFLQYNPATSLVSPPITSFENSRVFVSGGAVFDRVVASSYTFNPGGTSSWDVFRATDPGTILDLSSLTMLSMPDSGYVLTRTFAVTALNGGYIDLSNVTTLDGPGGNNWMRFNILSGGQINLDSVEEMSGRVYFRAEVPMFELPLLASVSGATFFSVGSGSMISLPLVAGLNSSTLSIDDGGTINAPVLTSFTNGLIQQYNPATTLISPPFTEFDHSRVFVSGGAVFDRVAATSYTFNPGGTSSWDVFGVTGPGSVLDLTSLESFSMPDSGYVLTRNFTVSATNGGMIDLANVSSVQGPGGNNWARFHIFSGSTMRFGDVVFSPGRIRLDLRDVDSRAEFLGSAVFHSPAEVIVIDGAVMSVAGNLAFNHTNEAQFRLEGGVLQMVGDHIQTLEVAGADLGLPDGDIPLNFQIGQLIVGDFDRASIVELVDVIDNGNRGPDEEPESLYLTGFPEEGELIAEDGLRVLCGSTLFLNGIDLYSTIDGQWTHINALFPKDVSEIKFDGGYINLGTAFDCMPADLNCDGVVNVADLLILFDNWGDCADQCDRCTGDLNGDFTVNVADLLILFDNWG